MIFKEGHVSRQSFVKDGVRFFQIITVMKDSVEVEIESYYGEVIESIEVSSISEIPYAEEFIAQSIYDWIEQKATEVDYVFARLNGWRDC